MSTFSADAFLEQSIDGGMDTTMAPPPEGVTQGQIKSLTIRKLEAKNDKPEQFIMEVVWLLTAEAIKVATGMENPTARQSIWLDTNEGGGLDNGKGKNVTLGKLRDALGQNKAGKTWSPSMLQGGAANVLIVHETSKTGDGAVYAKVSKVSAL